MNILEAANELSKGKKVRLSEWEEGKFIQRTSYGLASACPLFNQYGGNYLINMYDLLSDNWELYEEPREYFGFFEAMRRLEAGKKVTNPYQAPEYYLFNKTIRLSENTSWGTSFEIPEIACQEWYEVD